ncbi:RNA polymerase sigma factor [Altericroceibacterium endophyticum]|uniref:Sigma-70 family RNA polymerase sigma factor n=1 Tax=Altericroceibacterium endophyticum TaxID=1808508 RepID=A0A6I4T4C9_9SPHN|nr:sigma-70 family RNA polymerase sigma factor [Altericroceibacterium endophyticum]MXO65219.1 sigma-70 family RNA polymerase sigma factor [Altericroceibacterium endophyticum]
MMNSAILESGWNALQRQIFRRTHHDDAEDFLQTSFLRMIERKPENVRNPSAFLMQSALNEARDQHRRSKHPAAPRAIEIGDLALRDTAPLPDETLIAQERLARVREGLDRLTPRTREIFLMHRLDGLKYREIAQELGISMSAVEKHIAKAMLFLDNWASDW